MNINSLKRNKKKLLMFGLPLLAIGLVAAAWILFYAPSSSTGMIISSDEPVLFSDTFSMNAVDVTNSDATKTETISVNNVDGSRILNVDYNTTFYDVTDGCSEEVGDYNISVIYNDGTLTGLSEGLNVITAPAGNSQINVTTYVKQNSCPGTLETNMSITG